MHVWRTIIVRHGPVQRRGRSVAGQRRLPAGLPGSRGQDRKSTRLNSSHLVISYAVFCLKKKNTAQHLSNASATTTTRDGRRHDSSHKRVIAYRPAEPSPTTAAFDALCWYIVSLSDTLRS